MGFAGDSDRLMYGTASRWDGTGRDRRPPLPGRPSGAEVRPRPDAQSSLSVTEVQRGVALKLVAQGLPCV